MRINVLKIKSKKIWQFLEFRQSETTCGSNQIVRLIATMLVYISMPVDCDMWISLSTLHKHSSAWLTVSCKIWGWNTDIRMTMRQFVFMKDSINWCSVDPLHNCVPRPNHPFHQYLHVWGVGAWVCESVSVCTSETDSYACMIPVHI